jgi:hypothetical protein
MNKSKFAGLAQARLQDLEGETIETGEAETGESETPARSAKQKARKQASKKTSKLADKKTSKPAKKQASKGASNEADVNLVGIALKVPQEKRIWWNVQAKLQQTTLTDAIIEALDKRFGLPRKLK